jgi:hypothetical protein
MSTLAFFAGVFDGEGCVDVARQAKQYRLRVRVVNTCRNLVEALKERFGGTISTRKQTKKCKVAFEWSLSGAKAQGFLTKLRRFFIVKREIAALALEFARQKAKIFLNKPATRDTAPLDHLITKAREVNRRGANNG